MSQKTLDTIGVKTKRKGFVMMLTSIIIITSLCSYSRTDTCFNVVGNSKTHNLLGFVGANIADFLYQYLGIGVFPPIIFLFYTSLLFIIKKPPLFLIFKTIYIALSVFSLCFLLSIITVFNKYTSFPFPPGGYLGIFLSNINQSMLVKVPCILLSIIILMSFPFIIFAFGKQKLKEIQKKNSKYYTICKFLYTMIKKSKFLIKLICFTIRFPITSVKKLMKIKNNKQEDKNKKIQTNTKEKKDIISVVPYNPPISSLLKLLEKNNNTQNQMIFKENLTKLSQTLGEFGVRGDMIGYRPGPIVTLYEFKPYAGVKISRVVSLCDDIARTMMVSSVRIATISGRDTLGIEIPNKQRDIVCFRKLIESNEYENTTAKIPMILGCNIFGRPIIADLTEMPHLLVAGTTGSGKSVGINGMILSILYKLSPEECKIIMIDPKMLEFSAYEGIPHLLLPVVTDAKNAIISLKWVVKEMEDRYRLMSEAGVRNITGYNEKAKKNANIKSIPYIIVIIDEMADLMVVAKKDIEILVQRIAQMARAAGIHLITATQRPSVDVITGVIKANFPTRISYHVTSKIDSRTILGEQGAEQLLGKGDLLFMLNGSSSLRIHGPLITDSEIENVVNYIKKNNQPQEYIDIIQKESDNDFNNFLNTFDNENDNILYQQAIKIVLTEKKTSISYLQRKLRIGYNKAANFIEKMEENGILSSPDHTGKRTILLDDEN